MATKEVILKELSYQEGRISTANLAEKVGTTEGSIRSHLSKLKTSKYVDGSAKDGWLITTEGSEAVERGEKIPTTPGDVGADTESKLKYYGQLAGVDSDLILACNEMILTGDPEDLEHVWDAMTQMDVPIMARRKWFNLWRNHLKQGIPPHLKDKVMGNLDAAEGKGEETLGVGKNYIIADDEPVRVGENLGDFTMQDAKDILQIRALRTRFTGASQAGAASQPGTTEKVSDLLTALAPYLNKGSDDGTLKELIATQMELQKQEILSRIPQLGQAGQPKSFIEQISGAIAALSSLKDAGPMLRAILGITEPSSNPASSAPVQLIGLDGQPVTMDLGQAINWQKFQGEEKRADAKQKSQSELFQAVRENIPDGIQAILATVAEVKGATGTEAKGATLAKKQASQEQPQEQPQVFACADCQARFSPPAGWAGQPIKCPNPECGREYSKEELEA